MCLSVTSKTELVRTLKLTTNTLRVLFSVISYIIFMESYVNVCFYRTGGVLILEKTAIIFEINQSVNVVLYIIYFALE